MSVEHFLQPFSRLTAAGDDFLLACEAKRLAPKTLRSYKHAIDRFTAFAGDVAPDRLDAALLRRWQRSIAQEGLTATSQADYLRRVKTWLTWLADEDVYGLDAAIIARVKAPRRDTEQPLCWLKIRLSRSCARRPRCRSLRLTARIVPTRRSCASRGSDARSGGERLW